MPNWLKRWIPYHGLIVLCIMVYAYAFDRVLFDQIVLFMWTFIRVSAVFMAAAIVLWMMMERVFKRIRR